MAQHGFNSCYCAPKRYVTRLQDQPLHNQTKLVVRRRRWNVNDVA